MPRLARRLQADALGFALRFVAWFAVLTIAWSALAPAYAAALAGVAGSLAPVLEPDARWEADGPKIVAVRPLPAAPDGRTRRARMGLWSAAVTWNTTLFVAAVFATPGWSWPRRARAVAIGVGVLALGHLLGVLVNAALTRHRLEPTTNPAAALGLEWLSGFLDIVVAGVLPIGLYLALAVGPAGALEARDGAASIPGRNDPCPCGSGTKYKRCCGA